MLDFVLAYQQELSWCDISLGVKTNFEIDKYLRGSNKGQSSASSNCKQIQQIKLT